MCKMKTYNKLWQMLASRSIKGDQKQFFICANNTNEDAYPNACLGPTVLTMCTFECGQEFAPHSELFILKISDEVVLVSPEFMPQQMYHAGSRSLTGLCLWNYLD
uniref:Uncharacterized protein n=1 Tax=Sphaerodactylus townsendi TaxID=933632 RepID=A0ACB8GD53_9SAUR